MYKDEVSITRFKTEHIRHKRWQQIVLALGVFVVFCTTYALILPAITMEKTLICEKPEHIHTAGCYETVEVAESKKLICTKDEHEHTDACLTRTVTYICGNTDPEHIHTEECIRADYEVVCNKDTHIHDASCYKTVPAHTEQKLICTEEEHVHTDACYDALPDGKIVRTPDFEKEVNGLTVSVWADEGALPYGATMTVEPVDNADTVENIKNAADIKADRMVAVDISFRDAEGTEIEPSSPVKVRFTSDEIAKCEAPVVVHMDDNGETQVVEPDTEPAPLNEISFDAELFSVYAVFGGEIHGRRIYEFYKDSGFTSVYPFRNNAGVETFYQIVKDGEALQVIPDPDGIIESPDGQGNTVLTKRDFLGWYTESGEELILDGTPISVTNNETVRVYPKFSPVYYITFYSNENGNVIHTRMPVSAGDGQTAAQADISSISVESPEPNIIFAGWKYKETDEIISTDTIEISGDTELLPVFKAVNWIRFHAGEAGTSALYVPSMGIVPGEQVSSLPVSEIQGYVFDGWYTGRVAGSLGWETTENDGMTQGTRVTDSSGNIVNGTVDLGDGNSISGRKLYLNADLNLYGKWSNGTAKYTIIYWKQQVTDDKDVEDAGKKYDYSGYQEKTANVNSTISSSSIATPTGSEYTFFRRNTNKVESITVDRKGSSVINVYMDRKLMTINFYIRDNNSYNSWPLSKTFTGLYGQTLRDLKATNLEKYADYKWGWEYDELEKTIVWKEGKDTGTTQTYLDGFIFPPDNRDSTTYNLYSTGSSTGSRNYHHYLENVDGSFSHAITAHGSSGSFKVTNKFTGYEVYGTAEINTVGSNDPPATHSGSGITQRTNGSSVSVSSNRKDLCIFHKLSKHNVDFFDPMGQYENYVSIADSVEKKYTADLSGLAGTQPNYIRKGHVFKGWYKDRACTVPFDFNISMPNNDVQLFACWEAVKFRVKIDPNGGVLNSNEATYFNANMEETIGEYADIKRNFIEDENGTWYYHYDEYDLVNNTAPASGLREAYYTQDVSEANNPDKKYKIDTTESTYALVGWYKVQLDENLNEVTDSTGETVMELYDFNTPVTEVTLLRAVWRRSGSYTIEYDNAGVQYDNNNQIVEGSTVTGSDAPSDNGEHYSDKSNTFVLTSPTPPDGYAFVCWALLDDNGNIIREYNPGDQILINSDYADGDGVVHLIPIYMKYEDLPVEASGLKYSSNTVDNYGNNLVSESGVRLDEMVETAMTEGTPEEPSRPALYNEPSPIMAPSDFTDWDAHKGYTFLGWDQNSSLEKGQTPKFRYDINSGKFYTKNESDQTEQEVTYIAADERPDLPNTLYAIWEPTVVDVTITKRVVGTGEDEAMTFNFNALFRGFDDGPKDLRRDFTLGNEGTEVLDNVVPFGAVMTVTETESAIFNTSYEGIRTTDAYRIPVTPNVTLEPQGDNGNQFVITGCSTITIVNARKEYLVSIKKTNEDGTQPLEGATFSLSHGDTVIKDNLVSGSDGILKAGNNSTQFLLATGTYTMTEIEAPPGYIREANPIVIDVKPDKTVVTQGGNQHTFTGSSVGAVASITVEVTNSLGGHILPHTGGSGTYLIYIAGALMMAVAPIIYVKRRKRASA
ncbi:MAG: InlB B-repeat-containing protein [Clostridia bacterium]|nr:InlB B-repeat-containing protein [Clostridia bacterium]